MTYPLRQEYLISYDIEDTKLRTGVFKELGKYGMKPVQKSVFWGYLTMAELQGVKRYLSEKLQKSDKAFITHTHFNGYGQSYCTGHHPNDFKDWKETDVI